MKRICVLFAVLLAMVVCVLPAEASHRRNLRVNVVKVKEIREIRVEEVRLKRVVLAPVQAFLAVDNCYGSYSGGSQSLRLRELELRQAELELRSRQLQQPMLPVR